MRIAPALPQASSVAARVDLLFDVMLALSALVVLGVFTAIVGFCIRYRRGSTADRSGRHRKSLGIELAWTLVPLGMFVGLFVWSIALWSRMLTPPADAAPVYVVSRQWMWKVQHPGGQREIDTLHVPLGQDVKLVMTSQDVIHSFYVPAFRLKQDVLPGRYTQLWFRATRAGRFDLSCAEFCGTGHSRMGGSVVVMRPADYARWLDTHAGIGLAQRGAELFRRYGCSGCHDARAAVHAPDLDGLYGSTVPVADGTRARADDAYLHDAIMLPRKQVAAGYAPIMPAYQGRIDESDVLALVAYLKSRAAPAGDSHDRR